MRIVDKGDDKVCRHAHAKTDMENERNEVSSVFDEPKGFLALAHLKHIPWSVQVTSHRSLDIPHFRWVTCQGNQMPTNQSSEKLQHQNNGSRKDQS